MFSYLKAENLKFKGTFTKKLIFIAPVITLFFGFMSGPYFQVNAFNWWYIIIFPGTVALFCALANQKDEKKMKYRAIFPLDINLKKAWISKIGVIAIYTLLASFTLSLGVIIGKYIITGSIKSLMITISSTQAVVAAIIITITSLWQIPLCLFLAKKFGFFSPIILNTLIGMVLECLMTTKSLWWVCPYSWPTRLMCPVLRLLPNGLPAEAKDPLLNASVIPIGIILSIALFATLLLVTSNWFKNQEVA